MYQIETDSDAWDDAAILRAFDTALSEHRLAKDDGDGKAEEDGEETQSRPVKITRARDEHEKSFAVADSRFEQLLAKGTEAGKARTAAVAPVTSRPSRSVAAKPKAEGVAGPWKPVDHDEEAAAAGATAPQSAQNGTWAAPMDPATVAAAAAGYDYAAYYAGHNAYDAAYPGAWGPNSLPYMPAPLPGYFPPHHYARDGAMPQPPPPPPHQRWPGGPPPPPPPPLSMPMPPGPAPPQWGYPHAAARQALAGVEDDELADLLLAWYYSGYYMGRYQASRQQRHR